MPITELIQPTASNALLTFNGGAQTLGFTSGVGGSNPQRAAIATSGMVSSYLGALIDPGGEGVAWWVPGVSGSPWVRGFGRFDVTGGAGNDRLGPGILGASDDTIRGGAGDDTIIGAAAGQDFLDGGPGQDTLNWSWAVLSAPLTFMPAAGTFTIGGTTITGFEALDLILGGGDDTVIVDHTAQSLGLNFGLGNDIFIGDFSAQSGAIRTASSGPNYEIPEFRFGTSVISFPGWNGYENNVSPERFNLRAGGGDDALLLGGTPGFMSALSATIEGGAGNDTIWGTDGDDILDGGSGIDTVWLAPLAGRPIRLGLDMAQQTGAGTDLIRGFENAIFSQRFGSLKTGWLIGDSAPNSLGTEVAARLEGMAGDDTLTGSTGHDILTRGPGTNSVTGGTGSDTLIIDGARRGGSLTVAADTSIGNGLSGFSFSVQGSFTGPRETTSFSGIETLIFTDGRLAFDPGDPAMQVARLYETALNRAPNPYELNFWIDRLAEGMTLARAGDIFAGGVEFVQHWGGLSNAAFISRVYANSVERAPNSFEASFWATQLNGGMSRGDVLTRLSEYHEARGVIGAAYANGIWDQDDASASIARLYQATLNRRPEEAGLRDWRAEMAAGKSLAELVPGFTNSVEFTTLYGATSNQAFVTLLYNNVLGRAPDAAGFAGWVAQLDAGGTRTDVVLGFSESLEFRLSTMSWIEGGIVFA